MTGIIALLFAYIIYRHASGKARYNRAFIFIICVLSVGLAFVVAYIGYLHNPAKDRIRFRDVL